MHENGDKRVRMAHLAFLGSTASTAFRRCTPSCCARRSSAISRETTSTRIVNKTNGITFRRWLYEANQPLTQLLIAAVGDRVLDEPGRLQDLAWPPRTETFVRRYRQARRENKAKLADVLLRRPAFAIDPEALFDVHIKRIHEYKRQLLNLLETVALYQEIRSRPHADHVPRVKIFAGKAAASYDRAKMIIKLAKTSRRW